MAPPQKTRDLARSLVASEADAATTALHTGPATVRVYERLRRQLGAPVGVDGFQALASRALALARSESPRLSAVQITANGALRGLGEVESQADADEDGEAGVILIAQLLGLFLTFLGEATTLRLIEDLRLQVEVGTESATATATATQSAADGPAMAMAFEDLLREIDRLRSVSDHIETLRTNIRAWRMDSRVLRETFAVLPRFWTFSHSSEARPAARKKKHLTCELIAI